MSELIPIIKEFGGSIELMARDIVKLRADLTRLRGERDYFKRWVADLEHELAEDRAAIRWLEGQRKLHGEPVIPLEHAPAIARATEEGKLLPIKVGVTCGCGRRPVHSTIDPVFHPSHD